MTHADRLPASFRPVSLSGHHLSAGEVVRTIYVDESGISNNESVCVVVALIVHADTQWRNVAETFEHLLHDMPAEYKVDKKIEPFVFHTAEMLDAKCYPNWNIDKRREIVHKVMEIPRLAKCPIAIGVVKKGCLRPLDGMSKNDTEHYLAFALAISAASRYLQGETNNELGLVVAENVGRKAALFRKSITNMRSSPMRLERTANDGRDEVATFQVTNIIDEVHFVAASRTVQPLQIADAMAYGLRRFLEQRPFGDKLMTSISGLPDSELDRYRPKQVITSYCFGHGPEFSGDAGLLT
jgi:Protein of unknown function (DUF3800)